MKIPKKIKIGGQDLDVKFLPDLDGGLGRCCLGNGLIKIAEKFDGLEQTPSSQYNTFWHEVVHAILDTMGEKELSANEKFVCSFSGFLTECIRSIDELPENNENIIL